ncbi:MAG: type II toxin-antitoxin system Phd/YefM family antitoxin [Blautia sp.]|nr:type II toxin-antitoxin system Phd/YefM family antitoxin [Blautia sp.]
MMKQVNMLEAKTDLSRLVRLLETGQEEVILIARNGMPVVQMTLAQKKSVNRRIGVAKGKFTVPDAFDQWDKEIEDMFGGAI